MRFPTRLILITILFFPTPATAQDPPAQPAAPPPPPRHEITAELAFVGTTGNSSTNTLGVTGDVISRPGPWTVKNKAAFVRNRAAGVLTAEAFQYQLRGERTLATRLSIFSEYGYLRDRFSGVAQRHNLVAGVGVKVLDGAAGTFVVDASGGYLEERRLAGANVSSVSYGVGETLRWRLSTTATLDDELRLTGTVEDTHDWRATHVVSITAQLTERFSLKASNAIRFLNRPAPGFRKTDTTTSIALVAKLRVQ